MKTFLKYLIMNLVLVAVSVAIYLKTGRLYTMSILPIMGCMTMLTHKRKESKSEC